jgi:hypothetical protein
VLLVVDRFPLFDFLLLLLPWPFPHSVYLFSSSSLVVNKQISQHQHIRKHQILPYKKLMQICSGKKKKERHSKSLPFPHPHPFGPTMGESRECVCIWGMENKYEKRMEVDHSIPVSIGCFGIRRLGTICQKRPKSPKFNSPPLNKFSTQASPFPLDPFPFCFFFVPSLHFCPYSFQTNAGEARR